MPSIAPIVLFVYARPEHTRRTLEALAANALAEQTDLIVYADAPRNDSDIQQVREVRNLVHSVLGFRSVNVIERKINYGLARNIIEGVTEICDRYGRVIVLEDDIVTGPHFLGFMNAALDRYVDEKRVWHVSGWNYPIDASGLDAAFFWRVMNCWGWATWADRWRQFEKNPDQLIANWVPARIERFNLDGSHDFWRQVLDNRSGRISTWAVFWYATIFKQNGLCLNPSRTYVYNIGHDGTGENCLAFDPFGSQMLSRDQGALPECIEESALAVHRVKAFYASLRNGEPSRMRRMIQKLTTALPILKK